MLLHGCSCMTRQRGLGAMIVPAHLCWDGKTKVINDSDCPPVPVSASAPAQPVQNDYIVPPREPSPEVQTPIALPRPISTYVPPPIVSRDQFLPTVQSMAVDAPQSEVVQTVASGGSGLAPIGAGESIAVETTATEPSKFNWFALLSIATALYELSS